MSAQTPPPPPPPDPNTPASPAATSMGLDPKLAALLAYLFGWISGLVILLIEKSNQEVRFHAAQSLLFSAAITVVYLVLTVLANAGGLGIAILFSLLIFAVGIFALVMWIILMIKGYGLQHFKLPIVGDYAEQLAGGVKPVS